MPAFAILDPRDACDLAEALALAEAEGARSWVPLPHQIPPADNDWQVWMMEGGRGSGKTDGAAHWLDQHCTGPACIPGYPGGHRPAIIAPTLGDALESCVNGPSGLRAHNRTVRLVQGVGGTHVRWPNGVEGKLFGAFTPEDVERLRAGGNRCVVWAEELAAWVRLADCWDQMKFGLRLGSRPRVVVSTTPKPRKKYLEIRSDPQTRCRGASTYANPHLPESVRHDLEARYAGTRLGRQELDAEVLLDVEGALWSRQMVEDSKVRGCPPLARIVVAVDPAVSTGSESDLTGIVVAGLGEDGRGYVIWSDGVRMSPDGWAKKVVGLYHHFQADRIVAEANQGGAMVEAVLRTVDRTLPIKLVHASKGKRTRAEPIAALWEQGRVSIVI